MYSQSYYGTESDGMLSSEYCSSCYKGGQFYNRGFGMQGMNGGALPWAMFYGGPGARGM